MATKNNECQLWLSVSNQTEADNIAQVLLTKQLIVCAKQIPVKSSFRWQGKIENAEEILLIMESHIDLFDSVEAEVAKLHSYDTFVLEMIAVDKLSVKAKKWVKDELISV